VIKVFVSSCLLGAPVRYDGRDKKSHHPILQRWLDEGRVVSVCPEMLGGLGTPRPPAEIVNDGSRRVVTPAGADVTAAFEAGARAVAVQDPLVAVLKDGSPSCGSSFVYDGTFSKTRVAGDGVTAALLRARGVAVFSEDEIDAADEWIRRSEVSSATRSTAR
jgi:uncharacterized protein YbbK (DUF523 family)